MQGEGAGGRSRTVTGTTRVGRRTASSTQRARWLRTAREEIPARTGVGRRADGGQPLVCCPQEDSACTGEKRSGTQTVPSAVQHSGGTAPAQGQVKEATRCPGPLGSGLGSWKRSRIANGTLRPAPLGGEAQRPTDECAVRTGSWCNILLHQVKQHRPGEVPSCIQPAAVSGPNGRQQTPGDVCGRRNQRASTPEHILVSGETAPQGAASRAQKQRQRRAVTRAFPTVVWPQETRTGQQARTGPARPAHRRRPGEAYTPYSTTVQRLSFAAQADPGRGGQLPFERQCRHERALSGG
jgi:hypothetical protein